MGGDGDGDEDVDGDGDGDGGALPPAAAAYDFRTGRPLQDPNQASPPWRPEDDADELGIWAPRDEPSGPVAPAPPAPPAAPAPPWARQPATYQQPNAYQRPPTYQQSAAYQQPSTHQQAGTYPAATAEHPPLPPRGGSRTPLVVLLLGLLLAVGALAAVLFLTRSPSDPSTQPTAGPSPVTSAGASPATSSPGTTSSGGSDAAAARAAFTRDVDGILTASADGRRQIVAAINGVRNSCAVTPSDAAGSLTGVIANRRSVLAQASDLTAPDATTATVKADLVQALTASLDANQSYQRWLDNALAANPDSSPAGCPDGQVPFDSDYDAATAASGRASTAKQNVVAAYNPLARQAGLSTWTEDEF